LISSITRATRGIVEGSVEQAIDKKIGVPKLTNFTGRVGVDLRDKSGRSLLIASDGPVHLEPGSYTLEVRVGKEVADLPRQENIRVVGEGAPPAVFDAEVTTWVALTPIGEKPAVADTQVWRFQLTVPAEWKDMSRRDSLWITIRQNGIACHMLEIPIASTAPEVRASS
jgi:hypothetical protein